MPALALRSGEHRAGGAFDVAVAERDLSNSKIDVPPSQPEQLGTTRASHRSEHHEHVEVRLANAQVLEEDDEFLG